MKLISNLIGFIFFSFVSVYLFSAIGCFDSDHPMDELISSSAIEKAVPFTIYDTEVQEGKNVNGGVYVQGSVNVPFNISWEAVKPTALAALKKLKHQKKPESKWFKVFLVPEGKAGAPLRVSVASAEFENDHITINYNILSAPEMTKLVEKAGNGEEVPDIPTFLTKKHFDAGVIISTGYNELIKLGSDPESAYFQIADELGSDFEKVKLLRSQAINYYTYGQEQETIQ